MKRRKAIKYVLYLIGAVVIAYAAWNLWQFQHSKEEAQSLYSGLAQQARENAEKGAEKREAEGEVAAEPTPGSAVPADENGMSEGSGSVEAAAGDQAQVLPLANDWLTDLQEVNSELAAWIRIPGTNIDYPVMQTKIDNDFYMDHDFLKEKQDHGTPFLDFNCDIYRSENLIVYGHHMKDETMFQNLMKYKEADFCVNNGQIFFSIPETTFVYQVDKVMIISRSEAEEFPYYKYIDLSDPEIYREYLEKCEEYSIWSSGEDIQSGTPLLTLSTCEYSKGDGRLVVIARRTAE